MDGWSEDEALRELAPGGERLSPEFGAGLVTFSVAAVARDDELGGHRSP